MNPWITRAEAWTAAGRGLAPLAEAVARGEPLARPVPWAAPGLRAPFAALLPERVDVRTMLEEVVRAVLPAAPGRCGLVVGSSSGFVSGGFERWHREGGVERAWRQAPALDVAARLHLDPVCTVSIACASGTAAFGVATGWLRDGRCDRVVVAGVEALSLFIHAGFAGLGALSPTRSRPFAAGRDGLMLGEGAAAFLLEPPGGGTPLAAVRGVGLSQDAVHLTAPDRSGDGLRRAAAAACGEAVDEVDCVSAHATGTPFNDAMEARALRALFGRPAPVHAAKPVVGHTLGAAGAVETAALLAMLGGAPPPPPVDPGDTELWSVACRSPRWGLKLSAAFGGHNAALLLGPPAPSAARPRALRIGARAVVEGTSFPLEQLGAPPTLGRADLYVRAGIAVLRELELDADTALVLSSESGCRAADLRYHRDLIDRGPGGISRVHFAYTIPGAPIAEAAILRQVRGPALVICGGAAEGRAEAEALVRWGAAPRAVAVHVEAPDAVGRAEAVVVEGA